MEDVFGVVNEEVKSFEDALVELRMLYIGALRNCLVSGNLGVEELIKLGKYLLPNPDLVYRVSGVNNGGSNNERDIRSLLKVVNE